MSKRRKPPARRLRTAFIYVLCAAAGYAAVRAIAALLQEAHA